MRKSILLLSAKNFVLFVVILFAACEADFDISKIKQAKLTSVLHDERVILEGRAKIEERFNQTLRKCKDGVRERSFIVIESRVVEIENVKLEITLAKRDYYDERNSRDFDATVRLAPIVDTLPTGEQNQIPHRYFNTNLKKWSDVTAYDYGKIPTMSVKKEKGEWHFSSEYRSPFSSCEQLISEMPLEADLYSSQEMEQLKAEEQQRKEKEIEDKELKCVADRTVKEFFAKCGNHWWTVESSEFSSDFRRVIETTGLVWELNGNGRDQLSLAEQADGSQWKGRVSFKADYFRSYSFIGGWDKRRTGGAPIEGISVEKQNGKWYIRTDTLENFFLPLSCGLYCSYTNKLDALSNMRSDWHYRCEFREERIQIKNCNGL